MIIFLSDLRKLSKYLYKNEKSEKMKQSLIKTYKKEIIVFYILAAVSLAVASFFDLKIDIFLNHPSNLIANWFEQTGEMPASLLITIALAFILKCANPRWMKIVAAIGCLVAGAYFGKWFGGRLFADNDFQDAYEIIFGVGFAAVVIFVMHFITIPENVRKPLLIIAFVGLGVCGLGTGLTNLMKMLWGRVRFRSMTVPYSDFTPWYILNGSNGNHSFPSGHTNSAGSSYLLMLLPLVSEKCRKHKTALFMTAFIYTSTVALTRLVMGAHYLSDVTIGGTISFTSTLLGMAFYEKFSEKLGV